MSLIDEVSRLLGSKAGTGLDALMDTLADMGGLGDLPARARDQGMGELVQSWISSEANMPITPDQVQALLGSGAIDRFAERLGVQPGVAARHLSSLLPQVVDSLTPTGILPRHSVDGILAGLGGLLRG